MTTPSFDRGPYLLCALLCERVLHERDDVKSAIRIVDRVTHRVQLPNPPPEMEPFDYDLTMLVRLKTGETGRGTRTLQIRVVKPSQETSPLYQHPVLLEGEEDRGMDVIVNMRIRFEMTGIYWFQVLLDGVQLTRVPFRVVYMPITTQTG